MTQEGYRDVPMIGGTAKWVIGPCGPEGMTDRGVVVSVIASNDIDVVPRAAGDVARDPEQAVMDSLDDDFFEQIDAGTKAGFVFAVLPPVTQLLRVGAADTEGDSRGAVGLAGALRHAIYQRVGRRAPLAAGCGYGMVDAGKCFQFCGYDRILEDSIVIAHLASELNFGAGHEHGFIPKKKKYIVKRFADGAEMGREISELSSEDGQRPAAETIDWGRSVERLLAVSTTDPGQYHISAPVVDEASNVVRLPMPVALHARLQPVSTVTKSLRRAAGYSVEAATGSGQIEHPAAVLGVFCGRRVEILDRKLKVGADIQAMRDALGVEDTPFIGFCGQGQPCCPSDAVALAATCAPGVIVIAEHLCAAKHRRTERAALDKMRTIAAVGLDVSMLEGEQDIARRVLDALREMQYRGAMLSFVDEEQKAVVGAHALGENWQRVVKRTERLLAPAIDILPIAVINRRHYVIEDSTTDPRCDNALAERAGIYGQVVLPLVCSGDLVLGTLQVQFDRGQRPSDHDVETLRVLAATAAQAIRRIRRRQELNEHLAELTRVSESEDATLDDLFASIAEVAARATASEWSSVRIYDSSSDVLYYRAIYPEDEWQPRTMALTYSAHAKKGDRDYSLGAHVFTQVPVLRLDDLDDPQEFGEKGLDHNDYKRVSSKARSALHVRLQAAEQRPRATPSEPHPGHHSQHGLPLGVITVNSTTKAHYDAEDEQALTHLARHLGVMIRRHQSDLKAKLMHRTLRELTTLTLDKEHFDAQGWLIEVLAGVAELVKDALRSHACAIFIVDTDNPRRVVLAAHTDELRSEIDRAFYDFGEGLTGAAAQKRVPIRAHRVSDADDLKRRYGEDVEWRGKYNDIKEERNPDREFVAAPIMCEDRCLGVIRCLGKSALDRFSEEDEELLCAVADAVGVIVVRSWLIGDLFARDQWRSTFVRLLTHQIRGRIANLRASLELLVTPNDRVKRTLHEVLRLEDIVNAFLRYEHIQGRIEEVAVSVVDIREVVREARREAEDESHRHGVRVTLKCGRSPRHVRVAADLLRECFINILYNAIRFSPRGESVDVRMKVMGIDQKTTLAPDKADRRTAPLRVLMRRMRLPWAEPGVKPEALIIYIADRGPGIPEEEQSKVFDEFVSIGREGSAMGPGLGLPIARSIARGFGGEVGILKSEVGKGTTFGVLLPLWEEGPQVDEERTPD